MRWVRLRRRSDLVLAVADIGFALLVALVAYWLRFEGSAVPGEFLARYRAAAVSVAVAWVVAGRAAGLYSRAALRPGQSVVEDSVEAGVLIGIALAVANPLAFTNYLSRAWIALIAFGLMLAGISSRWLIRHLRRALVPLGIGLERYALLGDDAPARRLYNDLTRAPGAPFRITERWPADLSADDIVDRARRERLDGIILSTSAEPRDAGRLAGALSGAGVDVLLAPGLSGLELRAASIAMLYGVPLLRAAGLAPSRRAVRARGRRTLRRGVAILGTRGIPANYGGFETFAEHLARHLVDRGIPVTVYCRRHYATEPSPWHGVRLVSLPTIRSKYLDTVVHTFLSALHLVLRTRIRDVVLCNAANAPVLPVLRAAGTRVVMNVDGLEWRRTKWGIAGRAWYRLGEWLSVRMASALVTDAEEVRTYYHVRHDSDSVMIPYGADLLDRCISVPTVPGAPPLAPDGYVLYVSRWERENNPDLVATAHRDSGIALPLVMLGASTYDDELDRLVRESAAVNAVFPGPIYGDAYRGLQANARCYVHATEVGGTHPALIEALGAGNVCLVLDTPENREVAGDVAEFFADADELAELLRRVSAMDARELGRRRELARRRARDRYSWEAVGDRYLHLLRGDGSTSSR